jgi:hypothetical protein
MSSSEHLATDNVGPSPGQGSSSSTLHSHVEPATTTSTGASSGPGHAHQVAQAQGLKLDTAASNQSSSAGAGGEAGRGGGPMEGSYKRPGGFAENPNARSKTITLAEGENTYGVSSRSRFLAVCCAEVRKVDMLLSFLEIRSVPTSLVPNSACHRSGLEPTPCSTALGFLHVPFLPSRRVRG